MNFDNIRIFITVFFNFVKCLVMKTDSNILLG